MSMKCIPFKPHIYTEKVGFAGVYLFFLFLVQNIDCGNSLSTINVLSKFIKNIKIYSMKFSIFAFEKIILHGQVFIMIKIIIWTTD